MARLASQVRRDPRLKLACTVCTFGDRKDCAALNVFCGVRPGVCLVDRFGHLEEFVELAKRRAAGKE